MPVRIFDRSLAERFKAERQASPMAERDEVWDGEYVVSPIADFEHQEIVTRLSTTLSVVVEWPGFGSVLTGFNVSDRIKGWERNYRIPDIVVTLKNGVGTLHKTHLQGGPDFLVEVLSQDDPAPANLDFYGKNGVREAVYIHRDPWAIELFRNADGSMILTGRSTLSDPQVLHSEVVQLSLRLVAVEGDRPVIEVCDKQGTLLRRI